MVLKTNKLDAVGLWRQKGEVPNKMYRTTT